MSSCVVRWCKRRKDRSKKITGITYHMFPKNAIHRAQWIAAVRLERREADWVPSKASRVCSMHFEDEDMYLSPTGNQMLKKTAVPVCTMVRYPKISPSVQACTKHQKQMVVYSREDLPLMAAETATSNGSEKMAIDILEDTYKVVSIKEEQHDVDTEQVNQENLERYVVFENENENVYDEFHFPIRKHLEQQLSKKTMLAEKRLKKIIMLQRRNRRLLKRNKILKDVIKTLKNKRFGKSALHTAVSGFCGCGTR